MKTKHGTVTFECVVPVYVRVTATGYSDPGLLSGPPERCYPPEGECNPDRIVALESQAELSQEDLGADALDLIADAFYEALTEDRYERE